MAIKQLDIAQIKYSYLEEHKSGKVIAQEIGVSMETVYVRLRKAGILHSPSEAHSGERAKGWRSGNWRGGKYLDGRGYVLICCPSHPNPTQSEKYVYEHRLVMEGYLGRYLSPIEVVHHKGTKYPMDSIENKQDNRLENLQLFPNNTAHLNYHRSLTRRDE